MLNPVPLAQDCLDKPIEDEVSASEEENITHDSITGDICILPHHTPNRFNTRGQVAAETQDREQVRLKF